MVWQAGDSPDANCTSSRFPDVALRAAWLSCGRRCPLRALSTNQNPASQPDRRRAGRKGVKPICGLSVMDVTCQRRLRLPLHPPAGIAPTPRVRFQAFHYRAPCFPATSKIAGDSVTQTSIFSVRFLGPVVPLLGSGIMGGGNSPTAGSAATIGTDSPQPSPHFQNTSQRRRLTKKPPPSGHHHSSSHSIDGRSDVQRIQSKRSSTSLKRAPSAPVARRSPSSNDTSGSASPRHPAGAATPARLQNPDQQNNEFVAQHTAQGTATSQAQNRQLQHSPTVARMKDRQAESNSISSALPSSNTSNNNSRPLSSKTSDELIGAPFDGGAILHRIQATKSPSIPSVPNFTTNSQSQHLPSRPAPPAPSYTTPDTRTMAQPPALRQSASFTATDSAAETLVNEKSMSSRMDTSTGSSVAPKRYSDESREPKMPSLLRKKTGLSGFMSNLVGSPKKPLISAPENPVHVTHVGYDSQTGQFTVSSQSDRSSFCRFFGK